MKEQKQPQAATSADVTAKNQPDEAEVHAQGAVDARAVDAQEHAVRDARPAGVFGGTIKTYLLEGCNVAIREDPREETLTCSSQLTLLL